VQVVDATGKKIFTNDRVGAETMLDLSSQPKGTYTVKVWLGSNLFVEEIRIESKNLNMELE